MASAAHMTGITYALNAIHSFCVLSQGMWILDNAASEHMCSDQSLLQNISILDSLILVSLPNGTQVKVTQKGKLAITENLVLNGVLLVPNFKFNLLSIKRLCEQLHSMVYFSENLCILQAPSLKRPLAIGKDHKGLYVLDKEQFERLGTDKKCRPGMTEDLLKVQTYECNNAFS